MLSDIYNEMLCEFGDTLAQLSVDSDGKENPKGRGAFMTESQIRAVNFDKFKDSIARKHKLERSPSSCDALYMRSENEWFLIEFKNGKIDKEKIYQVRGKIFNSLLLLTERFNKTIGFTRKNLNFILVYNEKTARIDIGNSLFKLAGSSKFFPLGLAGLQKLYFKEVSAWTKEEFDSNFVEKHCSH